MRIEKIELIGFKSFAEKTTFSLHPGITCIVGPNGSGKSNVVDSFRWVLGEQSAKSLRGEKMEEVIFSGSSTKKPRGMSEVNLILTFDSPEQGNGHSQTATVVSRRLYRSGESEYLINRNQCRLKDIRDIFLDTGLEVRSYSILEQGKIGEIINAKPQDRRFLIEEVAGVMKYKVRRAEALSKLEASRTNLQRINDVISEVKRQINSLDRQVKKAERFKKLSEEMRAIELKLAKRDYTSLRESLDSLISSHDSVKAEEAALRAEVNSLENTIETKRIGLLDKEKALEAKTSELYALEKEISEAERIIAVSNTESNNLNVYTEKLSHQESEIVQKISAASDKKAELTENETRLSSEIEQLRHEISGMSDSIREMEEDLSEKEALIESKRKEVFRTAEELSHIRNEAGRISTFIDNLEKKAAAAARESDAAGGLLSEIETTINETDLSLINKNNEVLLLKEKKDVIAAELEGLNSGLNSLRNRLTEAREELASANSRLTSLREIIHEDLPEEILAEAETLHILTSVAEALEVDEAYEKAIESALSEKINGFLFQSLEDVSNAVTVLRQKSIGRTVLIPVGHAPVSSVTLPSGHSGTGIIGRASDIVRVNGGDGAYRNTIQSLLSNVFIVKDLSSAFSAFNSDRSFTFVTLDGEIVEPTGAVTVGGSREILKRNREIREIEASLELKKEEILGLEKILAETETSLNDKTASLREAESSVHHFEKEISLLRLTAENQNAEKEKINRKLSYLNIETAEALKEKESLTTTLVEKEAGIRSIEARKEASEQMVAEMLKAISNNKELYETRRSSITDLRLSMNSCRERLESAKKEIESSILIIDELSHSKVLLENEKSETVKRLMQCSEEVRKTTEALKEIVIKAEALRNVITEEREIIRSGSEEIIHSEQELKRYRTRLDSITGKLSEAEVSMAEHKLRIETLSNSVSQNYGISVESFESEPVTTEEEERLSEIREKIRELGPVNLGTIEEYEELRTRYEFLTRQQDDLNKSIAELEEAITKINSTTRKKLRDSFEELNAKFKEVFSYLFEGGKAELILTDENNVLESGIDIIAQPPGKKLQNINLLSGGEKALAALSLIFASFLIKPAPLCVLDEVDAPLDDSNVERFGKMLRELSGKIQFIVITHNRVTMEAADYIYGVTMEEPGVSKIISMKLTDVCGPSPETVMN